MSNSAIRFSIRASAAIGLTALLLQADTVTLRNGSTVQGTYLGGTARQIRIDQNGDIRTFDIGQVQSVIFEGDQPPPPPPPQSSYPSSPYPSSSRPTLREGPNASNDSYRNQPPVNQPPVNQPPVSGVVIPIDTEIRVRMIEAVNSDTSRLGQTFRASMDEPVVINGQEVIPRGSDVLTKLVTDQNSGKIEGKTVLTLALSTITINGRTYDVTSSDVKTESSSRGARSGKVIGGTAALGAIVGAIAGGGKGAAIGAGSGAALGTGAEVLTGGQKVKIPSETRLTFRLQNPVSL